jgi:hypothetical protein
MPGTFDLKCPYSKNASTIKGRHCLSIERPDQKSGRAQ